MILLKKVKIDQESRLNMAFFISAFLLFLNGLLSHLKKNAKFIAFILLMFMWILFWSNTTNPDYYNYLRHYNSIQAGSQIFDGSGQEFGYRALMKIAANIGFSFETFLLIVSGLSFALIHSTVKKFSKNYNYVYSLYFIFPFFLDVVQIRNFIAMAIFIFSVRYLLDDSIKSKVKYIFLILIASTIHYTALLYLPMLLIKTNRKNYLIRSVVLFAIIGSLIILGNNKQIPYINQIVRLLFDSDKVLSWTGKMTDYGFILFWAMQTMSFLVAFHAKKLFKDSIKDNDSNSLTENQILSERNRALFVNLVYWINLLAFIYFPFYLLASTFTRLMRNILILNYISCSIVHGRLTRSNRRTLFNVIVFSYVLFFFVVELYLPYKDLVIYEILQNNLFNGR